MLSPADADLARRDERLPGLATLLDPDAFADALRVHAGYEQVRSAALTYLRYKPATNCVAAYRLDTAAGPIDVYAKAHGAGRAEKLRKARIPSAAAAAPRVVLEEPGIVVSAFPDDAKLRVLRRLGEPEPRRRLLARVLRHWPAAGDGPIERLGYKPERRYVGRFVAPDGRAAALKFYTPAGHREAAASPRALGSRGTLRLAGKCGGSKRHCVLAFEWLSGRPLREALAEPGTAGSLDRVGAALAELHAQPGDGLPPLRPARALETLRQLAATLGFLSPPLAGRATDLAARVASRLAGGAPRPRAIHGDFYDKQVLLDTDRVAIVDLDRAARGDPGWDLGLFLAHRELDGLLAGRPRGREAREALLAGYREASGAAVAELGAHVADGLLRLAHHPFRRHRPDWPDDAERILARARQILDGAA